MRRTERKTERYDYKVLATVGTTEQDKYSLYKEDSDESNQSLRDASFQAYRDISSQAVDDNTLQVVDDDELSHAINDIASTVVDNNSTSVVLDDDDVVTQEGIGGAAEIITDFVEEQDVASLFANLNINSATISEDDLDSFVSVEGTIITSDHSEDEATIVDSNNNQLNEHSEFVNVNVNVNQVTNLPTSSSNNTTHSNINTHNITPTMDANQLAVEESTISEDIDDFLGENEVEDVGDELSDYDALAKRAEMFRSSYRNLHKQLQTVMAEAYEPKYEPAYSNKLKSIKEYINSLKHYKRKLQESAKNEQSTSTKAKYDFLKKQFDSMYKELTDYLIADVSGWVSLSDIDVSKRRQDLSGKEKMIQSLSEIVRDIVGMSMNSVDTKSITDNYDKLCKSKGAYIKTLDEIVKNRQLDQKKSYNISKLNVDIPKFKGYKGIDIYTFKTKFEKLHPSSQTPRDYLPELLINNYLVNPALILVKDATDIDDIWKRLIEAYGDSKRLLANKITELGDVEGNCKSKDPEKVIEGLSKVINVMKDLYQLASDHDLKQKLLHGDAMEKIHCLMGEGRFTRWVSLLCDKDLSDEDQQWSELLKFLEKEIKVNQQKILLSTKKKKETNSREQCDRNSRRDQSHHNQDMSGNQEQNDASHHNREDGGNNPVCKICNATDHVQTSGPNGSKLVQYFVCKKFVDMTPAQRFTELKNKNLCFQCLFPGADKRRGKHREGRCQRDFVCPHPSHSRFTGKKHVLVCDEHKADESNKEVLDEYKRRCIARPNQVELPPFTQAILIHHNYAITTAEPLIESPPEQLTVLSPDAPEFNPLQPPIEHVDQVIHALTSESSTSNTSQVSFPSPIERNILPDVKEESVYMLQTMEVEGNKFNLFFDGGCRKFVCRYNAIERLGSRATLLHNGPVEIAGVGGMTMSTPHGIYQVQLPVKGGFEALLSGTCMETITEPFPLYPLD